MLIINVLFILFIQKVQVAFLSNILVWLENLLFLLLIYKLFLYLL